MISILMPAYNAEEYIELSIRSILNQTYTNFELLICDDCSTDDTWEIINQFDDARIRKFKNKVNLGYLKTSNFLAKKVKGSLVTFQDADDYSAPERLVSLVNYLEYNQLDLVGSYCAIFQNPNEPLGVLRYSVKNDDIYRDLVINPTPPFCGSAILVRSSVIDSCGLYDNDFDRISAEDYDWIYRVALKNYKMGNIPTPLYFYRQHATGVSKTNHNKNPLALYSSLIAKDLYLARRNNDLYKNFDYFSSRYLKDEKKSMEERYYRDLRGSFLKNKKDILFNLLFFTRKVRFSKRKVKFIILALMHLLLGLKTTERIKNILRK